MSSYLSKRESPRYLTDLIVTVRMNPWNPFSQRQARLIDFSAGGFKAEFLENCVPHNRDHIVLLIPLKHFIVGNEKMLKLEAQIRWFDPLHRQIGGTYHSTQAGHDALILQILEKLAAIHTKNADAYPQAS